MKIREGDEFIAGDEKYIVIAVSETGKYVLKRANDEEIFLFNPN